MDEKSGSTRILIVTGLSGAGKSSALRALEDIGYFCIDNLPPQLIPKFAELIGQSGKITRVAVGIDVRGRGFFVDTFDMLYHLKEYNASYEILFLDAVDDVLVKRYQETRRAHPLQAEGRGLLDGIRQEREMLSKLRENANRYIDTSNITGKAFSVLLRSLYGEKKEPDIGVSVVSFGFKYGLPADADMVFDVRFVSNPFYIDTLRRHTGKDADVREYVMSFPETGEFVTKVMELLLFLLPRYILQGKNQLVVGVGCTGGLHRSVAIAAELYERLRASGLTVDVEHRDINKDGR